MLILACEIAFAAYKCYWQPPPNPNTRPYLAVYLTVLVVTTLGSFFARPSFWRACVQPRSAPDYNGGQTKFVICL